MPRTYTLTYDCVTPESAEEGDFSDCGFGRSPRDGTSTREGACIDDDHDVRMAALAAANDAATDTIESDEYDLQEACDTLKEAHPYGIPSFETWRTDRPEVESHAAVSILLGIMRDLGATEPSASDAGAGVWYTTPDGSTDYATGEVTRVSVHLDGWSEEEERAIYAAVTGRK
jgi:hypothetical protein